MDNFSLYLHKSTACFTFDGKNLKIKKLSEKDKNKQEIGRKNDLENFKFSRIDFGSLKKRNALLVSAHCQKHFEYIATPDYRLISGLGNASIYETSITLHHVYGFPCLSSTSIKGIVRDYFLHKYIAPNTTLADIEKEAILNNKTFCRLFGAPKENAIYKDHSMIGDIVFYDSYPCNQPNISVDVMTVHYKDYYGDGKLPPADWQEPNPISFLTLKKKENHNHFAFYIGLRKGASNDIVEESGTSLFDFATQLLKDALTMHGIGAKTAVGYGYFESVNK
jgi:CRISPR-associated protein Cmr6